MSKRHGAVPLCSAAVERLLDTVEIETTPKCAEPVPHVVKGSVPDVA